MFKERFLSGAIESDEGFSVRELGRDRLVYVEGGRRMSITIDNSLGEVVIFLDSVGRWNDDPGTGIDDETRSRVVENIRRAL